MQDKSFAMMVMALFIRVSVLSALVSTPAWAGNAGGLYPGKITFAPLGAGGPLGEAAAVPTLGTVTLILLALLLGFIAWVSMRKNGSGMVSSITLALAFIVGSGAGGLHWLQNAEAGSPIGNFFISDSGPRTFDVLDKTLNKYTNNTDSPLQPTSITYGSCEAAYAHPGTEETCTKNKPVAAGDVCTISCVNYTASDIRLKEGIVRVATAANGLPLYEYSYRGDSAVYRGVMAQDVLNHTPAAVHTMSNGYYAVDYGMLNLELEHIR